MLESFPKLRKEVLVGMRAAFPDDLKGYIETVDTIETVEMIEKSEYDNIPVKPSTKEAVDAFGTKGETYDQIILRMLKGAKSHEQAEMVERYGDAKSEKED